jgi:CRP-like cAMP-binding protein
MRKVLYLLAELDDGDLHRWLDAASVRHLRQGSELFAQGSAVAHLFLLVGGELEVRRNGRALARLWPGEVIGELSFLRARPASADLVAQQDSRVLALPQAELRRRLGADPAFSARFHRASSAAQETRRTIVSNDIKNQPASASTPTKPQPLATDELKSAARGADCTKGPDGVSFEKKRNKGQATHTTKRSTRP